LLPYFARLIGAALALPALALAAEPADAPGTYGRVHYDILMVENCGLLTAEVLRGFQLRRDELLAAEHLDETTAAAARTRAGIAFELEWQNRGLGGARGWCRHEGKAAALDFFTRFIDERYPIP